jgi:hypothetical protein
VLVACAGDLTPFPWIDRLGLQLGQPATSKFAEVTDVILARYVSKRCRCRRDFASKLFAFIKLLVPPAEIRGKLWKSLMPARAPLHTGTH